MNKIFIILTFMSLVTFSCFCVKQHLNFFDLLEIVTTIVSPLNCIYVPIILYMNMTNNRKYLWLVVLIAFVNILAIYQI